MKLKKILIKMCIAALFMSGNVGLIAQTFSWAQNIGSSSIGISVNVDVWGNNYSVANNNSFSGFAITKKTSVGGNIWTASLYAGGSVTGKAFCQSITLDKNGNTYITGYYSAQLFFNGSFVQGTNNSNQSFVIKIDSNGQLKWNKSFGGDYDDRGNAVTVDNAFNIYASGYISTGTSSSEMYIIKLDSSGRQIWDKRIKGGSQKTPSSISVDLSSNIVHCGYFAGNVDFDPGPGTFFLNSTSNDAFISKIDSTGNLIWAKKIGGQGDQRINSLRTDKQNNIIVVGIFNDATDLDPGINSSIVTPIGQYDAFLCKLDLGGNYLWGKSWGSVGFDQCNGIALDNLDNIYTTGSFQGTTDFDPGPTNAALTATCTIQNGNTDMYMSVFKSNGNFIQVQQFSGTGPTVGYQININNNNIYLSGYFSETTDFNPNPSSVNALTASSTSNDAFLCKLSNTVFCLRPNLTITAPPCVGAPITLTSNKGIAEIQWFYNGNLISTQTGWKKNGVTVAGFGTLSANLLSGPHDVFVDSSLNIIVADRNNCRIQKWAPGIPNATTIAGGNSNGSGANQFNAPTGVFLDKINNVYVVEDFNCRVKRWAPGGTTGFTVAGGNGNGSALRQFASPMGIFMDTSNVIYIADKNNHRIQKFLPGSTSASNGITIAGGNGGGSASNQLRTPYHVFVDDSTNLYVSDYGNNRIQKWNNGATSGITLINTVNNPSGAYVDKYNYVYVSEEGSHRVTRWAPNSTTGTTIAGGNGAGASANQLNSPQKITLDKFGSLYVADKANNRVQKFPLNDTLTFTPSSQGVYYAVVTTFDGCSFTSDPVVVSNSAVNLLPDTTRICGDSSALLDVGLGYSSYQWSNGATTRSISVTQNGNYSVIAATSTGCIYEDSTYVSIINARIINSDTSICPGDSVTISVSSNNERGIIYDIDGNPYETVQIGKQIWMKTNLRTSRYRSGAPINKVTSNIGWSNTTSGSYCWMNNDSASHEIKYGKLYNWYCVIDARGISPQGYRVPTGSDWNQLIKFINPSADTTGSTNIAGNFLKESGLLNWTAPNSGANNITGFTALPGGNRISTGTYSNLRSFGFWHANDPFGSNFLGRRLVYNQNSLSRSQFTKNTGLSIRCLKDTNTTAIINRYLWSNGDTTRSIKVSPNQTTTYYCIISNDITSCTDSVTISIGINPFEDTTKVCGDSIRLDAGAGFSTYLWSNGDTTRYVVVRNNGTYKVIVKNSRNCIFSDSTYVSLLIARIIQNDTTVCQKTPITLTLQADTASFVKDIDGNIYPLVTIGNQIWLQKNLNVSRYRNGDTIPQITIPSDWSNLTSGAWCWYNNDSATYAATYGKLYNWYAVNDPRGIYPDGFRVSSRRDWNNLIKHLDANSDTSIQNGPQSNIAGGYLKENILWWWVPNTGATNSSGFTGLPGGTLTYPNILFNSIRYSGNWWTTTSVSDISANARSLVYNTSDASSQDIFKKNGNSVRCLKNRNTYLWSTNDTSLSINIRPLQTAMYYVTVSNGTNACKDSVQVIVPLLDTAITILDTSSVVCSNSGSVRLQAGIAATYQWLLNDLPISNATSRIYTARQSGLFRVVVTDILGCIDTSRAVQVSIYNLPPIPIINVNGQTTICSNGSTNLSTNSTSVSYQWYNNNVPLVGQTNSALTINQSGQYTLIVTNANGCSSTSTPVSITVNQLPSASIVYSGSPFCNSLSTGQSVTRFGTSGGTYSSTPAGLNIDSNTGSIIPSSSSPGNYTVVYTISAANSCPSVVSTTSVTVTPSQSATINYPGTPYCGSLTSTQPVTRVGTDGGVYSSSPSGLSLNTSTGAIIPSASTPGNYTVFYTKPAFNGCAAINTSTGIVISAAPSASIQYPGSPFCRSVTTAQQITRTGTGGGGYTSSPSGLSINGSTGAIVPSSSTPGSYTVTYTIPASNGCPSLTTTTSVVITAVPSASISYTGSPYCRSLTNLQPITRNGTTGGVYTAAPAGLALNSSTGAITPSSSTPGTYTVTYTIPASNGCAIFRTTTSVTIIATPSAVISYSGSPFCRSLTTSQAVTRTGTTGGVYSSSPAGLSINSTSGAILPSTSLVGTYVVSYTIPPTAGCPGFTATTSVVISPIPSASITYLGSPYCRNLTGAQAVTLSGTTGGTYSASPSGLSLNTASGSIVPSSSLPGSFTVRYSIPAANGCSSFNTTTTVVITNVPAATISYAGSPYCKSLATPQSVTRVGTSGGTYGSVPAGLSISTSTGAVTPSSSLPGNYQITYSIPAANGCSVVNATSSVTITPVPSAVISYPGSPYCRTVSTPQTVLFSGTTGGIYSSTPSGLVLNPNTGAITPSSSNAGTYSVRYTIPASGGCPSAFFNSPPVTINSTPPVGSISPSAGNICEGGSLSIVASGGNSYQWFRNGTTIPGATSSTYQANSAGTYTVQVFSSNGCSALASNNSVLTLTKKPVPLFNFNSYCINRPIIFSSTSDTINSRPLTYRWSFGDGAGISTQRTPTYTYNSSGNFNVTLTLRPSLCPGLQASIVKNIQIEQAEANLRYPIVNTLVNRGVQLNARTFNPAATYQWTPATGLNFSNIYNPYFNSATPQQYIITIRKQSGCILKDTLKVNLFSSQDIFVPKGFSPNGDGQNDRLYPILVGISQLKYFQVYNRWGQKVYQSTSASEGWDGKLNGIDQPIETYTWIAEGIGVDGSIIKKSGGTILIR
jgi:uncharacterized protein (TIGR02145 family)/gliding motility-associated-like protein